MLPVIPHFAEECLEIIGKKNDDDPYLWPEIDKNILIKQNIKFVVQINGKTRGIIDVKNNLDEKDVINIVHQQEKMKNYIKDKKIKKTIFIKNKLINIIIEN